MDKKRVATFWSNHETPTFDEFLKDLDKRLMVEIDNDPAGVWGPMFKFFDSDPDNPLTPREFLQFWECLSEEERLFATFYFC